MTMNDTHDATEIRVLVILDCAAVDHGVMLTLTRLLEPQLLELTGLYVEDEDLLRAATLPGLREISLSGRQSNLEVGRVTREIADEAAAARRTFDELARQLARGHEHIQHRFVVRRGQTVAELNHATEDFDFVLVARGLRGSRLRARHGQSFTRILEQPKSMLFVNEPWASGSSVVVLGDDAGALRAGARVAEAEGLRLVVAHPPADGRSPATSRATPAGALERTLTNWDEESIAEACLEEDARLLIVPATPRLHWAGLIASLMDRLPCSVLKLATDE